MKRVAFALILALIVLQVSNADAGSRRNRQANQTELNSYFAVYGGFNIRPDATFTLTDGSTGTDEFDNGLMAGAAIGYRFPNFRVEGEFGYRKNDDAVDNNIAFGAWSYRTFSFMLNGYFDLELGPLKPYLGLGGGLANASQKVEFPGGSMSDSYNVFAYQIMAGVGIDITPRITAFAGYRFFATEDQTFDGLGGFESEYESHEFLFGFRFNF